MKKNNNKKLKKTPYEIKENTAYFVKNRLPAFILAFLIIFWTIASIFGIVAYIKTEKEDNSGLIMASADSLTLTRTEVDLLHFNGMIFPRYLSSGYIPYTLMSNLSFGVVLENGDYRPYIRVVNQNSFDISNRVFYFEEVNGYTEVQITVVGYPTNSFNSQDLVLTNFELSFVIFTDWNYDDLYNYFPYQCTVNYLNDYYESGYVPADVYSCMTSSLSFVKESPYGSDNYMNPKVVNLDLLLPYMDGDGFITCPFLSSYVEGVRQEETLGMYTFRSINNAQYTAENADRIYQTTDLAILRAEYNSLLEEYNRVKQELDVFDSVYDDTVAHYEERLAYLQSRLNAVYEDGKEAGYANGYDTGFIDGVADANTYSFTGLLSAVFDVPVRIFTSLFNFDVLGVNLANFFLSLLTCAIILFIIRRLL